MQFQRRDFLKTGLAGLAGLTMARKPFAFVNPSGSSGGSGKRLIVLPMRGGYDGLYVVPPLDSTYSAFHARRPNLAVLDPTNAFNDTSGHGLHPVMTELKSLWDNGSCALLHQLGWPMQSGSHFYCQDRNASARADETRHDSGWVVRAAECLNYTTTQTVSTGVGAILDVRYPPSSLYRPLTLRDLDAFEIPENVNDPFDNESRQRNAAAIAAEGYVDSMNPVVNLFHAANESAFDLVQAIAAGSANYGNLNGMGNHQGNYTGSFFGKNMLDLARLISVSQEAMPQYDVPLLGVTFSGGFDTHGNQNARMEPLLTDVDINLKAFVDDLILMGEFQNTAILVTSEFGRRVFENGNEGTDHGEGNNGFLIGGCVNGGNHFGTISTPTQLQNEFNVPVSMDFRHLFRTLVRDWLGITDPTLVIDEAPGGAMYEPDLSNLFNTNC